jgi:hypothetical protein
MQIPFIMMLSPRPGDFSFFRCDGKPTLPVIAGSESLGRDATLPVDVVYDAPIDRVAPPPALAPTAEFAAEGVGSRKPTIAIIARGNRTIMATLIVVSETRRDAVDFPHRQDAQVMQI